MVDLFPLVPKLFLTFDIGVEVVVGGLGSGESIAYGSSGELRVGICDLGVFVISSKVSRHLEGS